MSAEDPADTEWCSMDSVVKHIEVTEEYARLDSKTGGLQRALLVEAEASVRYEWHRLSLQDSSLPLGSSVVRGLYDRRA